MGIKDETVDVGESSRTSASAPSLGVSMQSNFREVSALLDLFAVDDGFGLRGRGSRGIRERDGGIPGRGYNRTDLGLAGNNQVGR